MARWLQQLSTYNLIVTHRPGKQHTNADALSRNPCVTCNRQDRNLSDDEDTTDPSKIKSEKQKIRATTTQQATCSTPTLNMKILQCLHDGWTPTEISQAQTEDENIRIILTKKHASDAQPLWSDVSNYSSTVKTIWRQWDRLELHGGLLYRRWVCANENESFLQLVVPKQYQPQVLYYFHDIPSAAHLGTDKMLPKIRQSFYWPAMVDSVKDYVRTCNRCATRKLIKGKNKAPLGQYHVGEPMERVAIDILGPLPVTESGNRYVLVMIDCFTKWTECAPLPNQEAQTVAKPFVNQFVSRFGTPLQLHSDQGRNFESRLFHDMCNLLHIDKTHTTSYHPQGNGTVERFNRTLAAMLTMYCETNQNQWDTHLSLAYRSSDHASTGYTPNKMMIGREIVMPIQAVVGRPVSEPNPDVDEYVANLSKVLIEAHHVSRNNIKKHASYQKRHYDLMLKRDFSE